MKLKAMCPTAAVLILLPVGAATAEKQPLTGRSIYQPAGYGAYRTTLTNDVKVCLMRISNGVRECRTRSEWAGVAHQLSEKQKVTPSGS
jgi:hypothetical protein